MTYFRFLPMSDKRFQIIRTYEEFREHPDGQPIRKRVALHLDYVVDPRTNSNSFVNEVIRNWLEDKNDIKTNKHERLLEIEA